MRLRQNLELSQNIFVEMECFAVKTEFGIVLEYFCEIEVGLRIFLSKKAKGRKRVGLRLSYPSNREKESKVIKSEEE